MELLAEALQKACLGQRLGFAGVGKVHVQRRNSPALRELDHSGEQMLAGLRRRPRTQQHPGARHRGERHSRQQLGVVPPAGAFVGVRPTVIENIFAVGMRLRVERHDANDRAVRSGQRQMLRRPPGARGRRAALLEGIQEGVANGRIMVTRAGIPNRLWYFGDRSMNSDRDISARIVHCALESPTLKKFASAPRSIVADPSLIRGSKDRVCSGPVQRAAKLPHWLLISRPNPCQGLDMHPLHLTLIALPLTLLPPSSRGAQAETLGDARVGFSAERILVIDGRSYVGKMWHMPGEQRHEQDLPALKPVFILRAGSVPAEIVLPQLHTVIGFDLPQELSLLGDPGLLRKPVGQETVNGVGTTKYAVEESTPAGRAAGSLWLSSDGIPMRCDGTFEGNNGKISTIHWELRRVKIGKQDPTLFEAPRGYARLPPEAAAPLLGIRLSHPPAR
jgi:hypothetical protein